MGNRLSLAFIGLALLRTSPALAGSQGNGAAQRNGTAPVATAHYSYCFGGRPNTVYFSGVITSTPSINRAGLNVPFGHYLTKTFGPASNDGGQCITATAMADAVNDKQQREAEFTTKSWKIIETNWTGPGAP